MSKSKCMRQMVLDYEGVIKGLGCMTIKWLGVGVLGVKVIRGLIVFFFGLAGIILERTTVKFDFC